MKPLLAVSGLAASAAAQECPPYEEYASERNPPFSSGQYELPFQRPSNECRTFKVDGIEKIISESMNKTITDPDLYRLFVNTWPSTVDTTVKWTGHAEDNSEEEVRYCSGPTPAQSYPYSQLKMLLKRLIME